MSDATVLSGRQRRRLRGLGHSLQPVVQVGKGGLSDAVLEEVDKALEDHELIKIRLREEDREERRRLEDELLGRVRAGFVGRVGRVVLLYREASDEQRRKVDPGAP